MIKTRPPRVSPGFTDTRDFEDWMHQLHRKLGISDITFDELAQRTPGTTVVSETSYGQSPAVGISNGYAREDHTHGTPSDIIMIAYAITLG